MSMKKTDLEKHLAKKLDGKLKSGTIPQRFGQGAKAVAAKAETKPKESAPKQVQLTCKLPADLAQRLREQAVTVEGGVNAILAQAARQWLESAARASRKE
ncbi:MAG: hypothetical protein B7X43_04995 [Thiomonas sp. 15-63-373]|nr:MAG: hypothetical protein B7X43_04995 [Thiomonas sp. 15-63-373]